jgi:hypothetical protein
VKRTSEVIFSQLWRQLISTIAWRESKQAFSSNPAGQRSPQQFARTLADTREFKKNAQLHMQLSIDIGGGEGS